MKTMPLFVLEVANEYQSVLLKDPTEWGVLSASVNRIPLANAWECREFVFDDGGNAALPKPEITTVYLPGVIAFHARLKSEIFPTLSDDIELLPVRVEDEDWLLVNCLKSTRSYDATRSKLLRGANGEVFLAQKLVATDPALDASGLFTIADSNRGQVFVTPSLANRIRNSGAKGVRLQNVGEILSTQ